jgi:hypothetical protein
MRFEYQASMRPTISPLPHPAAGGIFSNSDRSPNGELSFQVSARRCDPPHEVAVLSSRISLLVTIDVECDHTVRYRRRDPRAFSSVTSGIPDLLRPIWNTYGVRPIYFVSPEVVTDKPSAETLRREVEAGAILGTHLHSELVEPNASASRIPEFPCSANPPEIVHQKLVTLTGMFEEHLGCRPEWYRAGRFGVDLDTIRSLATLGYRYDSSVTPMLDWTAYGGPDHRTAPIQPYWISTDNLYCPASPGDSLGVIEVPVTVGGKRWGPLGKLLPNHWLFNLWLRPTHVSAAEQKRLIREWSEQYENPTLVIFFHSYEVMVRTSPYVWSRRMQGSFLKRISEVLENVHSYADVSYEIGPVQ